MKCYSVQTLFFDYKDSTVNQEVLFRRIIKGKFQRPRSQSAMDAYAEMDEDAKDLVKNLLAVDVKKRLGCSERNDLEIRQHPWFSSVNFGEIYRKEHPAPWVPEIEDPWDGSHFHLKKPMKDKSKLRPLIGREQKLFDQF